ncbi:MAG TPA: hypothetical protein VIE16_04565 [Phenylobacterium sp.]|jgi:hypothetical protein
MLAGLVEALAGDGGRLSLLSRHASHFAGSANIVGYDVDYYDEAAFTAALDAAGPIDLAVAWLHCLDIPAARRLAERVGTSGAAGRLFQVLGSATGDPARPDRLARAMDVAVDLPRCRVRQVVLGFQVEGGRSRWLTDAEISNGLLAAVREDWTYSVVGLIAPWSSRP